MIFQPTKPIINGTYLKRREALRQYTTNAECKMQNAEWKPGSRRRHFLILGGLLLIAVVAVGFILAIK